MQQGGVNQYESVAAMGNGQRPASTTARPMSNSQMLQGAAPQQGANATNWGPNMCAPQGAANWGGPQGAANWGGPQGAANWAGHQGGPNMGGPQGGPKMGGPQGAANMGGWGGGQLSANASPHENFIQKLSKYKFRKK